MNVSLLSRLFIVFYDRRNVESNRRMMRTSGGKETKTYTSSTEDSEMPRKCVVIRKKKIDDNMEKIELRYVAYNRVEKGSQSTTMEAINDAASYFRERAEDLEYRDEASSGSSLQKTLTVVKSEEKGKKNLNNVFRSLCVQHGTLKTLCDEIINEATYVLENIHPVTSDLIKKIANINTLSRQILANDSKMERLVQDENELAASKSKTSDKFTK
uniref:Uncharacterized protein n=2 Tax=Caenorhabditis tropicalis TaxID=1561998 RepID=A0A1I7TV77_9PELO